MNIRTAATAVLVFLASWRVTAEGELDTVSRKCGGPLVTMTGAVYSPYMGLENYYLVPQTCEWSIPKKDHYYIQIQSIEFNIMEKINDECLDYLSINDEKFCGSEAFTRNIYNGATLRFVTRKEEEIYEGIREGSFDIKFEQKLIPSCFPPCENGGHCLTESTCHCQNNYGGFGCSYTYGEEGDWIKTPSKRNLTNNRRCSIYGNKNIRTFDGRHLHFHEACEYTFADFGFFNSYKFTVAMKNGTIRSTSGLKSLKLTKDTVYSIYIVENQENKMEVRTADGIVILRAGNYGGFTLHFTKERIHVSDPYLRFHLEVDITGERVVLHHEYGTSGLCGNNDRNPDNDLETPSGEAAKDEDMFLKSWSQDDSCSDTTSHLKNEDKDEYVEKVCRNLYTAPFGEVLQALNPDPYFDACVHDMTICGSSKFNKDCECPSFTQYVQDYVSEVHHDVPWRTKFCRKTHCPENQVFTECASLCPKTCRHPSVDSDSCLCADECTCPEGLYLDGEKCVKKESCSCQLGDQVYPNGHNITKTCETCTCHGGQFVCTSINCNGFGMAFGDPNYLTFDGLFYAYDGNCEYTILELPDSLNVVLDVEDCGRESAFTCIKHLTIASNSFENVKFLEDGTVEIDNEEVELPYIKYNTLEIRQIATKTIAVKVVQSKVQIRWNTDAVVLIDVDVSLRQQTKGMLGNFNSKTSDEYTSKDGIVVVKDAFASSWKTNPTCSESWPNGQMQCVPSREDKTRCQTATHQTDAFNLCLSTSSYEQYALQHCRSSMCAAETEEQKDESVCSALSVFASMCAMDGMIVTWRSEDLCPMSCDNGKEYRPWSTSCGQTCRGISDAEECTITLKSEGCFCPEGKYEDKNGDCVDKEQCGCYYKKQWYNPEQYFSEHNVHCYCKHGFMKCTETAKNCSEGMIYSSCRGGQCQPTCANKQPICTKDCVPGCACPEGTYFNEDKCVTEDECTCEFEGKVYEDGQDVVSDCEHCICDKGKWDCKLTTMCSRTCSVTSGAYYKTFDNRRFHSKGTCTYQLMSDNCANPSDGALDIRIKSRLCEDSDETMCGVSLYARVGNDIYEVYKDQDVNHTGVPESDFDSQYLNIQYKNMRVGFYVVLEFDFPHFYIQISYDRKTSVNIVVSKNITDEDFGLQLCGLCGNLNELASDDFGVMNYADFVNSHSLDAECTDIELSEENACKDDSRAEEKARRRCNIIKSPLFKECKLKVDPQPFFDSCVEQACSCSMDDDCDCFCNAVASYANECGRRGVKANWRPLTSCPVGCEEFTDPNGDLCDIKYDVCKTCVKTCCNTCTRGCFEGCFPNCADGLLYDPNNNTCVPKDSCTPCLYGPTVIIYTTGATGTAAYTVGNHTTSPYSAVTTTPMVPTYSSTTGTTSITSIFTTRYTTATTPITTTPIATTSTSTRHTTGTAPASTAPAETTQKVCRKQCEVAIDESTQYLNINQRWTLKCKTLICEGSQGCAEQIREIPNSCPNVTCTEEETMYTDECGCKKCRCLKCIVGSKSYFAYDDWESEDGCVTMVCDGSTCDPKQVADKRDSCNEPQPCPLHYQRVEDVEDVCCPPFKCECSNVCPAEPICVGGSRINNDSSNECCTVKECLPTCRYNGYEYPNDTLIKENPCYDEYCECTDTACGIVKRNDIEKDCPESNACTNEDVTHYPTITDKNGCCKTHSCKCECKVYGDPHYMSFDGKPYSFQGVCQYTLVKYRDSGDLEIIADNHDCVPGRDDVSCVKSIIVYWKGTVIRLTTGNEVYSGNDEKLTLPVDVGGITVKRIPNSFLRLQIEEINLILDFKGVKTAGYTFIEVPMNKWFNKTVGLCGTCTNTKDDDFESFVGEEITEVEDFARSWEHLSGIGECMPCNPPEDKSCWNCTDIRHGNDIPKYCETSCNVDSCDMMKSPDYAQYCPTDVESYIQNCKTDMELTRKCSICDSSAINAYMDNCKCVKWRQQHGCPSDCPNDQVYKECVPECSLLKTCSNKNLTSTQRECSTEENFRGCTCPEGRVLRDENSDECVEERCCDCEEPECKEYEILVLEEGEDATDCCPQKKCICETSENPFCELPKVLRETDSGTPGCFRNECICPDIPTCEIKENKCGETTGCIGENVYGMCGCIEDIKCKCNTTKCPLEEEYPLCEKCMKSTLDYVQSGIKACLGLCCKEQTCTPIKCAEITSDMPEYPTPDCPFIERVATGYAADDVDLCCATTYTVQCIKDKCDKIPTISDCLPGHELVTISAKNSTSTTVREIANICPDVDRCCPHKVCVCKSCITPTRSYLSFGETEYDDGGCKLYSCNKEKYDPETGCYIYSEETPTCPPEPTCECYQESVSTPPAKGATDKSQWPDLCCTSYSCKNGSCGPEYLPGVEECNSPEELSTRYVTSGDCERKNCPISECICIKCVGENGELHNIGSTYVTDDGCETYVCAAAEDNNACPSWKSTSAPCPTKECNDVYENKIDISISGECCKKEDCQCKPYDELENVCNNWKIDASTCPDPAYMDLETEPGMYQNNSCCPEKKCVCKGDDELKDKCTKWIDYRCPLPNQRRIVTKNITTTNCCPDYECTCDCSRKTCEYPSWVPNSLSENCDCDCVCDSERCSKNIPTCGSTGTAQQTGTTEGGCCPKYGCVCNKDDCSELATANCDKYQVEYDWYENQADCCPKEKRCKCNTNTTLLHELCDSNKTKECPRGKEPYVANILTTPLDGMCCNIQCKCVSCFTDDNQIKSPGDEWTTTENCKAQRHRCSNERLTNTCHKIITEEENIPCQYSSISDYESVICEQNFYAIEILPKTGCCADYECVPCSSSDWTCGTMEKMAANETHKRCPGECVCNEPENMDHQYCLNTATCPRYYTAAALNAGETGKSHSTHDCCPDYKCVCDACDDNTVNKEDVVYNEDLCEQVGVKPSDFEKPCCQNYELQCNESCVCQPKELNCGATTSCFKKNDQNKCGCDISPTCECKPEFCPQIQCSECYVLETTTLEVDDTLACGGNCCPDQKCVKKECSEISTISIPGHCDFLAKGKIYAENDTCCAINEEILCNGTCPAIITNPESCPDGFKLVDVPIARSANEDIRSYDDCPDIDKCCPHKVCECASCVYGEDNRLDIDAPGVYSEDGCTFYTCTGTDKLDDGCYLISEETPKCPEKPNFECYATLSTEGPKKNAQNKSDWLELCCPTYTIQNMSCSDDYDPGPDNCTYPAQLRTRYEMNNLCEMKNCPISYCVCEICVDEKNGEHNIGTIFPSEDGCKNFTCVAAETGELCPTLRSDQQPCPSVQCNSTYENKIVNKVAGECCEEEKCECRPSSELSSICPEWKSDTSHCADPDRMELVPTGYNIDHKCCPTTKCQCKSEEERNCEKSDNYQCPENYTTVQIAVVNATNCCPDFDCKCDCSGVQCEYSTWTAKTSENVCNCKCSCDPSKCRPKPVCGEFEIPVQNGTTDKGCCPTYECSCDKTSCPASNIPCNKYQEKLYIPKGLNDCCPLETCQCIADKEALKSACGGILNDTCPDGYRKYYSDLNSECCGQCECTKCMTDAGPIEVGHSWNETEENCTVSKTCSNRKGSDGCNIVETVYTEKSTCTTEDQANAQCPPLQTARAHATEYTCCTEYDCECTRDNTLLARDCEHFDGIECTPSKRSVPIGTWGEDCCPEHRCECRPCEYKCNPGLVANISDIDDANTEYCCKEYNCICDSCTTDDGTAIGVGSKHKTTIRDGCNVSELCTRSDEKCEISKNDPRTTCQSIEDFQSQTCRTPFQKAVETDGWMDNNVCCKQFACVCNDTSANCPSPESANCKDSETPTKQGSVKNTADCCDAYTCTCKDESELETICEKKDQYKCEEDGHVRNQVESSDKCCSNYTCTCDPTTCKDYSFTCEDQYERYETTGGTDCCPKYACRCIKCLDGDKYPRNINTTWSEGSCNDYTCTASLEEGKCPTVTSKPKYNCEPVDADDCTRRGGIMRSTEESNGCCKECTLCKRAKKMLNVTEEFLVDSRTCHLFEALDVGKCEGSCPNMVTVNPRTGKTEDQCACCEPLIVKGQYLVNCGDDTMKTASINFIKSCKCTNE